MKIRKKLSLFLFVFALSCLGGAVWGFADEITLAESGDFQIFEQLIKESVDQAENDDGSAFGKVVSKEAKRLAQELKKNKNLNRSRGKGKKLGHYKDKDKSKAYKEHNKDKLKKNKNKKNK